MPQIPLKIEHLASSCTAFQGTRLLAAGSLASVALAVKSASEHDATLPIFVFNDATGRTIEFDLRGSADDVMARLSQPSAVEAVEAPSRRSPDASTTPPRGPGRPKLGVIGREVTLLPRHWEWLAEQPSGASVALRRLVDDAKRNSGPKEKMRTAQERAYHFMHAMAGNFPGFEEAIRALFANDPSRLEQHMASWPDDVRSYATRLASSADKLNSKQVESTPASGQSRYLEPTQESGRAFIQRAIKGKVVMLNLLRFRKIADYSASPELAPDAPISGAEAYDRYISHTLPHLKKSGGDLLFLGEGGSFLIGPEHERWDRVMLVSQGSIQSFMAFAEDAAYLAGLGHRTAAVEDSRLLPLTELQPVALEKAQTTDPV